MTAVPPYGRQQPPAQPYAVPSPAPAGPPRGRKGPVITLVCGLVMGLVCTVLLAATIASGARDTRLTQVDPVAGTTAQLSATKTYAIYTNTQLRRCEVLDPEGRSLPLDPVASDIELHDQRMVLTFDPVTDGVHQITCGEGLHPPVFYGQALFTQADLSRIGYALLAGTGMFISLVVTVVGLVWLLVRVSRASRQGR